MDREEIKRQLQELMETMLPKAKANLEEDGCLRPVVFALTPDGIAIVDVSFGSETEKRVAYAKLGRFLREKHNAYGAVLMNECWFVRLKGTNLEEARKSPPPAEHADRREALVCLLCTYGWDEAEILPFHREGDKIVWEEQEFDAGEFRSQDIFPAFHEGVH